MLLALFNTSDKYVPILFDEAGESIFVSFGTAV